jgi:hypothetical protein
MFLSHHQSARQNHNINTANTSFKNVAKLKYFGTTIKIKTIFKKKLGADYIWERLLTIQLRIFHLSAYYVSL